MEATVLCNCATVETLTIVPVGGGRRWRERWAGGRGARDRQQEREQPGLRHHGSRIQQAPCQVIAVWTSCQASDGHTDLSRRSQIQQHFTDAGHGFTRRGLRDLFRSYGTRDLADLFQVSLDADLADLFQVSRDADLADLFRVSRDADLADLFRVSRDADLADLFQVLRRGSRGFLLDVGAYDLRGPCRV
jgi:hypothetical protein